MGHYNVYSEEEHFLKSLDDTQSRRLLYALMNHSWKAFEEQFQQKPPKATLQFLADTPFIIWRGQEDYNDGRQLFKLSSGRSGHWGKDTEGQPKFIQTLSIYKVFQYALELSPVAELMAQDSSRCGLILLHSLHQEWKEHFSFSKEFIHNLERNNLQKHCKIDLQNTPKEYRAL